MGNNNNHQNNNKNVRQTGADEQCGNQKGREIVKRTNTGGAQSIADLFARAFKPNPVYINRAKTTTNADSVVIDFDGDKEMMNEETYLLNLTNPSLIIQLPLNVYNSNIPNASSTTAAAFTAAVTTILETMEMDTGER